MPRLLEFSFGAPFPRQPTPVHRHLGTKLETVNRFFRQDGEHQFIYDFSRLERMLFRAGFASIARRDFDPARDSAARCERPLCVDACQPA